MTGDDKGRGHDPDDWGATPGPWKRGSCDNSIIWAPRFRSTTFADIADEPGGEVCLAIVETPWFANPAYNRTMPSEQELANFKAETDANARLIEEARELQYITELFIRWMMPDPTVDIDALRERARAASHRIRGTGPCDPANARPPHE